MLSHLSIVLSLQISRTVFRCVVSQEIARIEVVVIHQIRLEEDSTVSASGERSGIEYESEIDPMRLINVRYNMIEYDMI